MELTITSVDHAPPELHDQMPVVVELLRKIPGDDRPDYWIGRVKKPIEWIDDNIPRRVTHLVLAARWEGTSIEPGEENLPIGIGYVTDASMLNDEKVDFDKMRYVAIGLATETGGGTKPKKLEGILSGTIGKAFGVGRSD